MARYVVTGAINQRVLQERAIVFKFLCSPPQPKVDVRGPIRANLSFYSGKRRSGGGNEMLRDTVGTTIDVIRKLTNAIGQQDRPISLAVWSAKRGLGAQ